MERCYPKLIEILKPKFKEKEFSMKKSGFFVKDAHQIRKIFYIESHQNGYSAQIQYAVEYPVLEKVFEEVFNLSLFFTLHIRCFGAFLHNRHYASISLSDIEDLEIAEGIVWDIFNNYAISFYQKNSALKGVLQSLGSVNIFQLPRPNFVHFQRDEESLLLELFLTQLFFPEQFESLIKHDQDVVIQASQKHEVETGEKDGYLYLLDVLGKGIKNIKNANWDDIRLKLKGM